MMHSSPTAWFILCSAFVGHAAIAQPDVYISEYQFQAAQMSAVRLDGTNPRTLFTLPLAQWLPLGMSFHVPSNRLYWLDSAGSTKLLSSNIDGTSAATLTPVPGFGRGCSIDASGRVYFTSNDSVYRCNADGTSLTPIFTSAVPSTSGAPRVDATNGHVYFGTGGRILRMNLNGGEVKTIVTGASIVRAISLDISAGLIYWIDSDTHTDFVGRARLDGSDFTVLIENTPNSVQSSGYTDLLVDPASGYIFTADEFHGTVRRYPIAGGAATVVFTAAPGKSPSGLALSTGEPVQAVLDCNSNGIADAVDIQNGAADCDNNGYLDSCQFDPCPQRIFLLDQGSDAANSNGRAVGIPSSWQVFQPFDVPAGGWSIGEVGIDGFISSFVASNSLDVSIFGHNATTNLPDESVTWATSNAPLRFNTYESNWGYAPVNTMLLPQGRYWVRISTSWVGAGASINHGFSGLQSRSRGSSGNFTPLASPIALRLTHWDPPCAADFNHDAVVDFFDYLDFVDSFSANEPAADFNGDGVVDFFDYLDFVDAFSIGC